MRRVPNLRNALITVREFLAKTTNSRQGFTSLDIHSRPKKVQACNKTRGLSEKLFVSFLLSPI